MKKKRIRNMCAVILAFVMMLGGFVPGMAHNRMIETKAAAKVKLNKTKITLEVGYFYEETYQLKVLGTAKKIKWSTSDKKIAIVNKKGKVTAKKAGKATITAKVSKKTLKCKVSVIKEKVEQEDDEWQADEEDQEDDNQEDDNQEFEDQIIKTDSVSLNKTSLTLNVGDSERIVATINPSNVTNKNVEWNSSDSGIVSVTNYGQVYAVASGTAAVTATSGGKSAVCVVTVKGNGGTTTIDQNINSPAYDILFNAIMNSGNVNKEGNPLIIYESNNNNLYKIKIAIIFNKKTSKFDLILIEKEDSVGVSASASTSIDRNVSKTIAVNCASVFYIGSERTYFDVTGYLDVASYAKYTEPVFEINDSSVSYSLCEKQAKLYIDLLLTGCELCLLENNVGVTMKDLGFLSY